MCGRTILETGGTSESIPNWFKIQEMCDKVVDNYVRPLEFVPDC